MGYFRQNNTSQRISYCWRDAIPPTIRCIAIPIQYNNIGLSPAFRGSKVSGSQGKAAWTRLALHDAAVPSADALTVLLLGAHSIVLETFNFR